MTHSTGAVPSGPSPSVPRGEPTAPSYRASSRVQVVMLRFAKWITAFPKTVIVVWALLIAVCFPFATQLTSTLTDQGASKVVPGTSSARAEKLAETAFPHRSQREVILVVEAHSVHHPPVRAFLARLEDQLSEQVRRGEIERTSSSAFTLYRDAVAGVLAPVREQAVRRGGPDVARRQAADDAIAAGDVPAALAAEAREAATARDASRVTAIAEAVAVQADWRDFPVEVPPEMANRLLSKDGRTTLVSVSYASRAGKDPDVESLRKNVAGLVERDGLKDTVTVHVTGELPLIHDTYAQAETDNALMESVAYAIIVVVLLLFFRALVPAVLTLVSIGLAMNVSQAALYLLQQHITLTQFTVTIMTFVMLGAGVDYSMLLSSRYRQERLAGRSPREAAVLAVVHAGESMLLAAIAVALAFGATLVSPVDWIPPLGYGGLVGIPIVLAAALTLTPCLLILLGDRFFALGRAPLSDLEQRSGLGRHLQRTVEFARRRKVAVILVFAALTVPLALVAVSHRSTADPVALSPATDSRDGFQAVARTWGDSAVLPTVVVGNAARGNVADGRLTEDGQRAVAAFTERLAGIRGVASVDSATSPFGNAWTAQQSTQLPPALRKDYVSKNGALRFVVALEDDPYSAAAGETVQRIQTAVDNHSSDVATLEISGATQVDRQYAAAIRTSFWQMVALVSAGVFTMLVVALRSLLIPVRLIATLMMSNVWAIGLTVLLFRDWQGEAIINDLPVFLTVLMMGLGMDYEIFLVTRVRDLVRSGVSQERAVIRAVVDTGRVINAAGMVMAGSLGTMVLSSTLMLQQYGTGLGLAVLLDATLIRMVFVPATLLLFDRYNWWLPNMHRLRLRRSAKAG
ncbi:MMPL family transporter [Streptomyces sp. NPDC050315]|uniref:MMPL family transporter n=1 Tax=Streptomyces sp. NPDC050315 TaxID=3155039 RepID=UPI00341223B0